jgi:hypothetical protein
MKLPALLFSASLVANVALFATFAFKPALRAAVFQDYFHGTALVQNRSTAHPAREVAQVKPSASAPGSVWSSLNANDLPTLVAHLRAAGFSSGVIRAIVTARIDLGFAARVKELVRNANSVPFWKPDPSNSFDNEFYQSYSQMVSSRSRMVNEALGPSSADDGNTSTDSRFGTLSKAKIDQLQRIEQDYTELNNQINAGTQGMTLAEDREKYALLAREKQTDLEALLTPQELQDYQLRASPTANRLRTAMTLMDASEEEYLAIFKIQQPMSDLINPPGGLGGGYDNQAAQQRRDAQTQVNDQLKSLLGDQRYADYVRASSSEYQRLDRIAQAESIPTENVVQAFNVRDAVSTESTRIYNDSSLSADDKRAALQLLAANAKAQIVAALGPKAGDSYVQASGWISAVERGAAVSFGADGMSTSYRLLPRPKPVNP